MLVLQWRIAELGRCADGTCKIVPDVSTKDPFFNEAFSDFQFFRCELTLQLILSQFSDVRRPISYNPFGNENNAAPPER